MIKDLEKISSMIKENKSFVILTHVSPDGDAIGSSFALAEILNKLKKDYLVVFEDEIPKIYSYLPQITYKKIVNSCEIDHSKYDVVVSLDSGDLERLGCRKNIFLNSKKTINIDHHHTNPKYATINIVD